MSSFAYASKNAQVSEKDKLDFLETLQLTKEEAKFLERKTLGQADNPLWKTERKKRLTASKFGTICKFIPDNDKRKIALDILNPSETIRTLPEVIWGNEHEADAKRKLETELNVKVEECGLFVDVTKPWLAASPDGLIDTDTIVEIKCPYKARAMTPCEAARHDLIRAVEPYRGEEPYTLKLKDNHYHMYQVQGQLHITGRQKCIYVLWTPKGISTEEIKKDDAFWRNEMVTKLDEFYKQDLLPVICAEKKHKLLPCFLREIVSVAK